MQTRFNCMIVQWCVTKWTSLYLQSAIFNYNSFSLFASYLIRINYENKFYANVAKKNHLSIRTRARAHSIYSSILPDSFPRTRRSRRREAVAADRRCCIWYPEIHIDRLEELVRVLKRPRDALHFAIARLDDPRIELALDRERESGRCD